ncbi:hypothetical protein [Bacillus taeanensis]|uniref:Uncharacterized protein n=1 Tax=Bacillus taeanensis TaxID=273032 RepID=A0A366XSX8_9BACI|nr:hypothetical protein [Bacillus taeanensis]RBW68776.1 hypothetical protein DS031_14615 [Bacillus taeanensis]
MKHMPYYMSFLGFFLTLLFSGLIGRVLDINWLMFYYYKETPSDGIIFEAGVSWLPIILSLIVSYLSWKLGKRKFPN